jgi:hypothetical protein
MVVCGLLVWPLTCDFASWEAVAFAVGVGVAAAGIAARCWRGSSGFLLWLLVVMVPPLIFRHLAQGEEPGFLFLVQNLDSNPWVNVVLP